MNEEVERDNSAKRLHVILTKALRDSDNGTIRDGWSRVFGLEKPDSVVVIQLVGNMLRVVEEIKIALHGIPGVNYQLYTRSLESILTAFAQVNLDAGWHGYRQKFTADALHGLEFISDVLDKSYSEKMIDQSFLDSVRKELEDLYQDVKSGDLANYIKMFLLRNISNLLFAIRNYEVFGPAGLRDMLSQSYGNIVLESEVVKANLPKATTTLERFAKIVKSVHSVIVLIRDGRELIATALPPLLAAVANK